MSLIVNNSTFKNNIGGKAGTIFSPLTYFYDSKNSYFNNSVNFYANNNVNKS